MKAMEENNKGIVVVKSNKLRKYAFWLKQRKVMRGAKMAVAKIVLDRLNGRAGEV